MNIIVNHIRKAGLLSAHNKMRDRGICLDPAGFHGAPGTPFYSLYSCNAAYWTVSSSMLVVSGFSGASS